MDDIVSGSLKAASNAQVGDNSGYDRSSLKGYVCESKLKKVVDFNKIAILEHLKTKFNISNPIKIRYDNSKENTTKQSYEEFEVIDLLKAKIVSFDSKRCLKLWDIYEEKGLTSLLNAIQYLSPIQKI